MAFSVVRTNNVVGNKRMVAMQITADAATQTIETGLKVIEFHTVTPASCASNAFKTVINSNASGVQSMGVVAVTGVASGDLFFVVAYGR